MGFLTFLAFPAAPPWMAVEKGLIPPITRISSQIWAALGIQDFPSVYNKISPNPVAAVPSLHAAYATLLVIFIYKAFGKKWALVAAIYPFIIYVGTVYSGEHYAIDEILGGLYALVAYFAVKLFIRYQLYTKFVDYLKRDLARW
jgi:membrane-associated phospholipid phosphatase